MPEEVIILLEIKVRRAPRIVSTCGLVTRYHLDIWKTPRYLEDQRAEEQRWKYDDIAARA